MLNTKRPNPVLTTRQELKACKPCTLCLQNIRNHSVGHVLVLWPTDPVTTEQYALRYLQSTAGRKDLSDAVHHHYPLSAVSTAL